MAWFKRPKHRGMANGSWAAIALVGIGLVVALVSLKFRQFTPEPSTQPTTDSSRN